MTAREILAGLNDLTDAELQQVARVARRKLRRAHATAALTFSVGEPVRFAYDVRPQMLAGRRAVVTGFWNGKVVVDLPVPVGRWHREVRCAPSMLTR